MTTHTAVTRGTVAEGYILQMAEFAPHDSRSAIALADLRALLAERDALAEIFRKYGQSEEETAEDFMRCTSEGQAREYKRAEMAEARADAAVQHAERLAAALERIMHCDFRGLYEMDEAKSALAAYRQVKP